MGGVSTVLKREWRYIWHHKRVLGLFCLLPAAMTLLLGAVFVPKAIMDHLPIGVVDLDKSLDSRMVLNALDQSEILTPTAEYPSAEEA